ncbi:4-hydroxybenzoate octaprenyltransferase [bacterium]|nr:4-hydroxybenzoate octaprenyltransferase [bacterium]
MNSLSCRAAAYGDFIKIGHTLFALPFCLIAVLIVWRGHPVTWTQFGWILLAFAAARGFAMAVNRILDRDFDARNPRTQNRHLPAGTISLAAAWRFAAGCGLAFLFAAANLSLFCGLMAPAVLAYLAFYSYTKRFTPWSHVVLGGALALAPLGVEAAVLGQVSLPTAVLAGGVLLWVAGFDIFYACLDADFDRAAGLFSLPARFGPDRAMNMAAFFHAAAFLLFLSFGYLANLGAIFLGAQIVILGILLWEHRLARRRKIETAVFRLNPALSLIQLAAVAADLSLSRGIL